MDHSALPSFWHTHASHYLSSLLLTNFKGQIYIHHMNYSMGHWLTNNSKFPSYKPITGKLWKFKSKRNHSQQCLFKTDGGYVKWLDLFSPDPTSIQWGTRWGAQWGCFSWMDRAFNCGICSSRFSQRWRNNCASEKVEIKFFLLNSFKRLGLLGKCASLAYTGEASWMEASLILMWHSLAHPRQDKWGGPALQTEVGTHTKEGALSGHREGNNQKPTGWLKYKTVWKCFWILKRCQQSPTLRI